MSDAGLEDIEGPLDIDLERGAWKLVAVQQPQGGKVENAVGVLESCVEDVRAVDVAPELEDRDPVVVERLVETFGAPTREVVVYDHLADVLPEKSVDRVGADQSRSSDDDQLFPLEIHSGARP